MLGRESKIIKISKQLVIPRNMTVDDFEKLITVLDGNSNHILRLSSKGIKFGGGLGIEMLVIQLIITWARNEEIREVRTYVNSERSEQGFSELCNHFSGMAYLAMAKKIFCDDGISSMSKALAFQPAKHSIESLKHYDFDNAFKGRKLFFPCLKPSKNNGFIPPLYNGNAVVSTDAFTRIINKSLFILMNKSEFRKIEATLLKALSVILYQLFKNTHEHARFDVNDNLYMEEVRGISFNLHHYSSENIKEVAGSDDYLNEYFARLFYKKEQGSKVLFLEASVVDSGPGFADNWLSKNKSRLDENSAVNESDLVLQCFEKYATTKNVSSAGEGLNTVVSLIHRLKGMFRLRTGRTSILWCYEPEIPPKVDEKHVRGATGKAQGAVFTFIIPLVLDSGQ